MRVLSRLVAAVVLTAATSAAVPLSPAAAAACPSAEGVSVVVDFHELGRGVQQVCDAGGAGAVAAEQFADAGFALTRVQRQRGFVCRVDGAPSDDPCVNTPPGDAYWGLWWSDGKSGTWSYSTQGVDTLKVPEGGYVALSWNGSETRSPPGAAPSPHPVDPSPTAGPTAQPSSGGGGSNPTATPTAPGGPSPTAGGTPSATPDGEQSATPTAGPTDGPTKDPRKDRDKPSDGASATTSASPETSTGPSPSPTAAGTADPADPSDGGLPVWVAPAGIALLFAAAAVTAVVRRRRGTAGP